MEDTRKFLFLGGGGIITLKEAKIENFFFRDVPSDGGGIGNYVLSGVETRIRPCMFLHLTLFCSSFDFNVIYTVLKIQT